MMQQLSAHRIEIAKGLHGHSEALRQQLLRGWERDGFDVSAYWERPITKVDPPGHSPVVDVVIPFHAGDAQFVTEAVQSVLTSEHVTPVCHVVADGCEFPDTLPKHPQIKRDSTPGGWGPHKIANTVSKRCWNTWFAIQDADDICLPHRLWRQVQLLKTTQAMVVSSAAENFVSPDQVDNVRLQNRLKRDPVIYPGTRFATAPRGACVNPTRMMRLEFFRRINGFGPFMCSADFDLDNRCRFAGVPIVDDVEIVARRRLQASSLTNGSHRIDTPEFQAEYAQLLERLDVLKASPTFETARQLGSLEKIEPTKSGKGAGCGSC